MLRKSVVFLALLLCGVAPPVYALGLGNVSVESALNEPLRVRIEILQLGDTRIQDVSVQMASVADFQRYNIDRVSFLSEIRFNVAPSADGNFVTLTTTQIVREPYLSFILDTRWPSGRLLSEHTILLDLPVFNDQQTQPAQSPVQQPVSPILQPSRGDTQPIAAQPAVTPTPAVTPPGATPEPEPVVEEVAPAVEPDPVEEPTPVAEPDPVVQAEPEPVEPEPVVAEPAPIVSAPEPVSITPETLQTRANETLTEVALRVRPNNTVTMQQTMLAIQRLNPNAFIDGNINRLRAGEVLRVPGLSEIQSVDAREAADEVSRQNRDFAATDIQPLAAPATTNQSQDANPQGQLSVVTTDDAIDADSASNPVTAAENAALDERIAALENQLAQQQEEADRARIQREELQARMTELESQIAAAQEIIRLQDLQLAQLQASLAEAAAQQAAIAAAEAELAATARANRPSLVDTVMGVLTSTTFFIIIGVVVLILLLVVLLLRRNRAKDEESDLDELEENAFDSDSDSERDDDYLEFEDDDLDNELEDIIGGNTTSGGNAPGQAGTLLRQGKPGQDDVDDRGAASFLDDLGIDLDAFNDDDEEEAIRQTAPAVQEEPEPQPEPEPELEPEPDLELDAPKRATADTDDDMDLTFDLSNDTAKSAPLEFDDGESVPSRHADTEIESDDDDSNLLEFEVGDLTTEPASTDTTHGSKASDASEIESLEFSVDSTPSTPPEPEPELELETFSFDTDDLMDDPAADSEGAEPLSTAETDRDEEDDNALDFDFGKTGIKTPEPAQELAEELETFDFDLDTDSVSTVVEKPRDKVKLDLDTDDFDTEPKDKTVIDSKEDVMLDFDFDDDDDGDDNTVPGDTKTAPPTVDDLDEGDLDDLDFLSDGDDIEIESVDDVEEVSLLSNDDEVATKLELAYAYRKMGDNDGAREILEEVVKEGSQAQVKEANDLMASLGNKD